MSDTTPSPANGPALEQAARSWLFAPADSTKKMTKAADGEADIVLLDLEDSVAPANKESARDNVRDFLKDRADRRRLWVRVNPLDGEWTVADLAAIMPSAPGGILLPKARGPADVATLDNYLTAFEAANGLDIGSTRVAALVTETPASMFTTGDYAGSPRLAAMSWGAEDLSSALGAQEQWKPDGSYAHPYEMARTLCLYGAAAAGVAPIETIQADFRDLEGLRDRARRVRKAGFRGMLAIHPAQVPVINEAFTPSEEELAHARAVVDAFAASPGAGTVGLDGQMIDRPHLALAQALLAGAAPEK
ncbi:CoA ester lyase [Qipengyuania sp. JC766]|uniref:HpcH/HpaI aldolase/citrate lyase family protein n=1 Tax=Qipengyuania sp. JC766 TaxID=3232139 RepID=UPI00345B3652